MPEPEQCRFCEYPSLEPIGRTDGYEFWECVRCRFVFTPGVTREMAHERYEHELDGTPKTGWAKNTDFLAPSIDRLVGSGGRPARGLDMLDFGAGRSWLPWRLRWFGHRVVTLDLMAPPRPHADRLTGDLLELDLPPHQFDLTYAFQVFEHLPRPRPHLEELLRLTRPGGHLVIHTDMEPPGRKGAFTDWGYVVPPDHCSFYRPRTFETFCDGTRHRLLAAGPKTIRIEKRPTR